MKRLILDRFRRPCELDITIEEKILEITSVDKLIKKLEKVNLIIKNLKLKEVRAHLTTGPCKITDEYNNDISLSITDKNGIINQRAIYLSIEFDKIFNKEIRDKLLPLIDSLSVSVLYNRRKMISSQINQQKERKEEIIEYGIFKKDNFELLAKALPHLSEEELISYGKCSCSCSNGDINEDFCYRRKIADVKSGIIGTTGLILSYCQDQVTFIPLDEYQLTLNIIVKDIETNESMIDEIIKIMKSV